MAKQTKAELLAAHPGLRAAGKPYADIELADKMIARLQTDPLACELLAGNSQMILTGTIGGYPWKGKADVVKIADGIFVDLKTTKDFSDDRIEVVDPLGQVRWQWVPWYDKYWFQMSIYHELLRQMGHENMLPVIVAVTKQDPPAIRAYSFENKDRIAQEIAKAEAFLRDILPWKRGERIAPGCRDLINCDWCRAQTAMEIVPAENIVGVPALPKWWRE